MRKIIILGICFCIFIACGDGKCRKGFSVPALSVKKVALSDLAVDTVFLDSIETSFVVESDLQEGKIFLLDKFFCTLYQFDVMGKLQKRYLGQGRARNETTIGRIETHSFVGDHFLLLDNSGGYYLYDKHFCFDDYFRLIYHKNWGLDDIYQIPEAYTQRYNDIVCRSFGGHIFFNVHLAHPEYNIITTMKKHLENNANIQEINLRKEDFGRLLAIGYPDSYQCDSETKAIFSSVWFDIDKVGNFYLTYEADSLVYVYDKDFNMKQCYGFSGYGMDLNYVRTVKIEEVSRNYRKERNEKGFYNWVEYVDETNVLFRSYQKSAGQLKDGLQIYKGGILIGDVEVPKGLKVMGYVAPYYYSQVISDEENECLYFYRFEL